MVKHNNALEIKKEKREQAVWYRRFWEHLIRDEKDMIRYVENSHYNPAKHGLVASTGDWKHTCFCRFVRDGKYHPEWGFGYKIILRYQNEENKNICWVSPLHSIQPEKLI